MAGRAGLPWGKNILYRNKGDGNFRDVTDPKSENR